MYHYKIICDKCQFGFGEDRTFPSLKGARKDCKGWTIYGAWPNEHHLCPQCAYDEAYDLDTKHDVKKMAASESFATPLALVEAIKQWHGARGFYTPLL